MSNRMKRTISGVVLAVLLGATAALMFTPVIDLVMAALAGAACYEVMKVAGVKNMALRISAIIFAVALPLGVTYGAKFPISAFCIIYVLYLVILTVANHEEISFEHLAVSIYSSFIIPIAFSTICLIADSFKYYDNIDKAETAFLLVMSVASALLTDVFAYEVGSRIGKHKMTPKLSPNKSWEGAIGGVVLVTLFMLLALVIFNHFFAAKPFFLPIWAFILITIVLSILSMFGDLMASLIKRNYGVKDYSNLIPGHGGIMDRFDSVIVVAPTLYMLVTLYETMVM